MAVKILKQSSETIAATDDWSTDVDGHGNESKVY